MPCARGTTRREGGAATQHEADRTGAANDDRVRDHSARHQRSRTRRSARGRGGRPVFLDTLGTDRGSTQPLNAGADRLTIKLLGRWLSNAFEEYPVLDHRGTAGLSALMV
jgi:hypothetical protein